MNENNVKFGPHWVAIFNLHPVLIVVALILFIAPLYIPLLIDALPTVTIPFGLLEWVLVDKLHIALNGPSAISRLGLLVFLYSFLTGYISYRFRSYILAEQFILLNKGVFNQISDSLRYELIYECDVRRVLGERSIGTGTLVIKPLGSRSGQCEEYVINAVIDPDRIREIILQRSGRLNPIATL